MPLYNIVAKKLKPSQFIVQKVDEGKALRTVLPFISRKLGIPSMKNYVAFACDENRQPMARLDMDIPLEEQDVAPLSYIYVSPIDATPKNSDGEELPLASELKKNNKITVDDDIPPPPPPLADDDNENNKVAQKKAEEEEAARKKSEEEAAARKKAEEEAAARKKAEEEAAARKKAEEEAVARKKSEEEAAARKKAEEDAAARKKAEEEAAARKKAEEEAAARKKAEEDAARKRFTDTKEKMTDRSSVVADLAQRPLHDTSSKGKERTNSVHSSGTEQRVQLNLVPDVIGVAASQDEPVDFNNCTPGVVARMLAGVAENNPMYHVVLLRLANVLLSQRPKRPQLLLWSHLQSKLGPLQIPTKEEKKDNRRRPSGSSLTFAPVGDTTEERLSSGAPAGPARVMTRYWAKLLLECKPDNPALFMWSKLEAKMGRESAGTGSPWTTQSVLPEDPTKAALLCELQRGTPGYVVLRGLIDLIFEKKPDAPELWMWYHLVSRFRSSTSVSGRSSAVSFRALGEELTGDETFTLDEEGNDTDSGFRHFISLPPNRLRDRLDYSPLRENNIRPRVKDMSTQTSLIFHVNEVTNSPQMEIKIQEKSSSPVQSKNFLLDRSPRELLQLPREEMPLPRHYSRPHGSTTSELEPSVISPIRHDKYEAISDPLKYTGVNMYRRSSTNSYNNSSPYQKDNELPERRAYSYDYLTENDPQRSEVGPMPPREDFLSPNMHPPSSESQDLNYMTRQKETQRAETLYEYNWLLQREVLRREQLEKEVTLLRRERELRERIARETPSSTSMALAAEVAARAQAEAETRLSEIKKRTKDTSLREQTLEQPPSELDIVRKRLELLNMEEARSRHLSLVQQSQSQNKSGEIVNKMTVYDNLNNPLQKGRPSDQVNILPKFTQRGRGINKSID